MGRGLKIAFVASSLSRRGGGLSAVVETINSGRAHFSEPDLDILLQSTVSTQRLRASLTPEPADAFVIAVPTPFHADHSAHLRFVENASRSVAKVLKRGDLVILESTSPVGTSRMMSGWLAKERPDLKFPHTHPEAADVHIANCPERILPGQMVMELMQNDRIIGGMTAACSARASLLYETFVHGRLHVASPETAEIVKLLENTYRDVNIAFANEVSILCDRFDLDPWEVISHTNRHPRVNILSPGPGVGGHCIAVDPWFLISALPADTALLRAARDVNSRKPHVVLDKVRKQIGRFREPVVACLGLAYKPDVDDLRESPAVEIVEALVADCDAQLLVVEPNVTELPKTLSASKKVTMVGLKQALDTADIIVVLVAHKQFRKVEQRKLLDRVVIDTVGLWRLAAKPA